MGKKKETLYLRRYYGGAMESGAVARDLEMQLYCSIHLPAGLCNYVSCHVRWILREESVKSTERGVQGLGLDFDLPLVTRLHVCEIRQAQRHLPKIFHVSSVRCIPAHICVLEDIPSVHAARHGVDLVPRQRTSAIKGSGQRAMPLLEAQIFGCSHPVSPATMQSGGSGIWYTWV